MLLLSQIRRHRFTTRLQVLLGHSSEELALSPTLRVLQNLRTVEDVQFRLTDGSHLTISKESWRLRISSLIHRGLKLRIETLKNRHRENWLLGQDTISGIFLGKFWKIGEIQKVAGYFTEKYGFSQCITEIRSFPIKQFSRPQKHFFSVPAVSCISSLPLNFTRPQFLEVNSIWRTKQTASAGHFTSYLEGLETSSKTPEPTTILLGGIPERNLGVICI